MRRIDHTGNNLASDIYWSYRGFTASIDTVRSGHRTLYYDVWDAAEQYIGEARSLRAAEELIRETIAERATSASQARC